MSSIENLVQALSDGNYKLQLTDSDELKIRGDVKNMPKPLIARIREHKPELIALLKQNQARAQAAQASEIQASGAKRASLSFAQARAWFAQKMLPESTQYNMPFSLLLRGEVDLERLSAAFARLVERHQILRTRYFESEGVPMQEVDEPGGAALDFEIVDLSARAYAPDSPQLHALLSAEANRPFNLQQDSVIRGRVLVLGSGFSVFSLTLHHIACDGWSLAIIAKELSDFYNTNSAKGERPAPAHQYIDYALWQQKLEAKGLLRQQMEYWCKQLQELPQVHELPLDRVRPALCSFDSDRVNQHLDKALLYKLYALASSEKSTLFVVLQAALSALMFRLSHKRDIAVSTPVAGRTHSEWEPVVGFFVNTLVLRNSIDPKQSFQSFLRECHATCEQAFAHQWLPFDLLVKELRPERSLSHAPLSQVVLSLRNNVREPLNFAGLEVEALDNGFESIKFDLELVATENDHGLDLLWNFATDIFNRATVERFAHSFALLLSQFAEAPEQSLGQVELVDRAQREQLIKLGYGPARHRHCTAHQLLEEWAERRGQARAIDFGEIQLSYAEFNARANQLARALIEQGFGLEQKAAICSERSADMVLAMFAVLKAGGAFVMLDPEYPDARLDYMLRDCEASVVLVDQTQSRRLKLGAGQTRVDLWRAEQRRHQPNHNLSSQETGGEHRPSQAACIVYTSGSTGKPKGAVTEHGGLVRLVNNNIMVDFRPEDIVAQTCNCAFDLALLEIFGALCNGASLCYASRDTLLNPKQFRAFLQDKQISILMLTQALFTEIANLSPDMYRDLRVVFFGGERADIKAVNQVLKHGKPHRLINAYGPAENSCACTFYEIETPLEHTVPIGRAVSGAYHLVLDAQQKIVPVGVAGELYLGGAGLARGYYNMPELSRERFVANPYSPQSAGERLYRSGDLVRYLESGDLDFIGRADDQIKIRGFRVELGEIEATLKACDQVLRVCVLAKGEGGDKYLIAYLSLADKVADQASSLEIVKQFTSEKLPYYMVPSLFVVLEQFPLTANGKIDTSKLPLPEVGAQQADNSSESPATDTEKALAGIWSELLGLEAVRRGDDFFELGGHSLLAVRLINAVELQFHCTLPISAVFASPSLRQQANYIDSHRGSSSPAALDSLQIAPPDAPLVASFAQERIWFVDQVQGLDNIGQYNVTLAFRVKRTFDRGAFVSALEQIVERHQILRVNYRQQDHVLHLRLLQGEQGCELDIRESDCSCISDSEFEQQLRAASAEPIDLQQGYPFFAHLFSRGEAETVVLLCCHHIVADGWSMGVLLRELQHFYNASFAEASSFFSSAKATLATPALQYSDFAHWQRAHMDDVNFAGQLNYWADQLSDLPVCHSLPLDHPRPQTLGARGQRVTRMIAPELAQQIEQLSLEFQITPFMFYQAAFAFLLAQFSHSEDIVLGTPTAGRRHQGLDDLIGCFINMLVLRSRLEGVETFEQLLANTREMTLAAFEHQDVPFETLVERLASARNPNISPLFQVLFAVNNNTPLSLDLEGADVELIDGSNHSVKYEISLNIARVESGHYAVWEYNQALFSADSIEPMAEAYLAVLEIAAANPKVALSALLPVSAAERQVLLKDFACNDPGMRFEQLPHRLFEQCAREAPQHRAIEWGDEHWSYEALNCAANRLAHYLLDQGVSCGDLVGIHLDRRPQLLVSVLAILKVGASYVPLDPSYPLGRLAHIVRQCHLVKVLSSAEICAQSSLEVDYIDLDRIAGELASHSVANLPQAPALNDVMYVLFTSGSTGAPKGVEITHRNVLSLLSWAQREFSQQQLERMLLSTSLSFDPSVFEIFTSLCLGHTAVLVDNGLALIDKPVAVSLVSTVPSVVRALVEHHALPATARLLTVGGEPLPQDLVAKVFAQRPDILIYNAYGPTECTVNSTCERIDRHYKGPPSIGRPLFNASAYVLSKHRSLLPVGAIGELYVGGDGVGVGYHRREDLTAERFVHLPQITPSRLYKTGDLVRFLRDGRLDFIGRVDHQVKIRGFRIELSEIERHIVEYPQVAEAIVLAPKFGEERRIVAYLRVNAELNGKGELAAAVAAGFSIELKAWLETRLPEFMVPSYFKVMEAFPLLPNGKVDKNALPEPEISGDKQVVAPRNEVESALRGLWSELLNLAEENISVDDNFFSLGGHSLLILSLINRIQQSFGQRLPLSEIYQRPSIAALADMLSTLSEPSPTSGAGVLQLGVIQLLQASDSKQAPLFVVHPVGGDVLCYAALVAALDLDMPVYGLQRPEFAGGEVKPLSMDTLVETYYEQIVSLQASGPYRLLGWSVGGMIAASLAARLCQTGGEVSYLGLIDTIDHRVNPQISEAFAFVKTPGISLDEMLAHLTSEKLLAFFDKDFRVAHLQKAHGNVSLDFLRKIILSNIQLALADSRRVAVDVLHYYGAEDTRVSVGEALLKELWSMAKLPVSPQYFKANHHSIVQSPTVNILAQKIKDDLLSSQ